MLRAMRDRPSTFAPACTAAFALAVLVLAGSAQAAPEADKADAFTRFLSDKGLLGAPAAVHAPATATESGLAERVRDKASDMVVTAMNFLGVPYKRGGSSQDKGFDCSGFTRHIFEHSLGLLLPRRVDEQARAAGLVPVKKEELQPGDLVFFNTLKRTFSHVGIYIGEGRFIHSPRAGGEVRVENMTVAYWRKRFTGARRVEAMTAPAPAAAVPEAPPVAPPAPQP
jgi:cell wall-associated NlpC family hydrolase